MQRRNLLVILAATVIAGIVVSGIAISGTIYTWEKTFEVQEWKPEIVCQIEVGDYRIVGCPVNVWVCMKLEGCLECCNVDCGECSCSVNGTYSANLYWWNETSEDWQHVKYLQEEINVTLTCNPQIQTYEFIPMWKGEYKVVVTFAVDSETYNFTSHE